MSRDKRVDAYIARSAEFAKPILNHIRSLVHKACPLAVEVIKWGVPHFEYRGILCSMAAFKQHCAFGFWKAALMKESPLFSRLGELGMGHLGRIESLRDLPSDAVLVKMIKEAATLNETGATVQRKGRPKRKALRVPAILAKALASNKRAKATFEGFRPSHKREYIEWIIEAKSEETRSRRLAQAVEWMAEGKQRNWKYVK